ncbi:MAG: winged helix-turn-helix transcriptional regulator [Austwickia sp.]|nr:winged helix-turn-helix transcriptional regulator [Austwickia sp.]MBK9102289.1 winged helix-turn-helix transcriptional regulator [Austwickia sp.]
MAEWTFFTNHAHVLLCIARDPGVRIRDMALAVGITERAAQAIVADLVGAGYVVREREGRRNRYQLHPERPLRHPLETDHTIGEVLSLLTSGPCSADSPRAQSALPAGVA